MALTAWSAVTRFLRLLTGRRVSATCFSAPWVLTLRTLSRVSRAGEGVGGVRGCDGPVRVCCLHGLGFGSDVTVVVRVDV